MLYQHANHRRVTFLHGSVQGGIAVEVANCIHISTMRQHKFCAIDESPGSAGHQRRVATPSARIHFGTVGKQNFNNTNVAADLDGCVKCGHPNVVANDVFCGIEVCDFVARRTFVIALALLLVSRELQAKRALDERGVAVIWHRVVDLSTAIDQKLADARESAARGHGEGWEDADVEIAVIMPLNVATDGPDIVVMDCRGQGLRLPAQASTLAADANWGEVFEFGNGPLFRTTIATKHVSTMTTMVPTNDD
mmetsp:Transcript_55253/g.83591  ORF Transcript_55253/g.83591 Transcript_55253/m.83591 type:complete len:251 (+) Transcript_55253:59-811(+)